MARWPGTGGTTSAFRNRDRARPPTWCTDCRRGACRRSTARGCRCRSTGDSWRDRRCRHARRRRRRSSTCRPSTSRSLAPRPRGSSTSATGSCRFPRRRPRRIHGGPSRPAPRSRRSPCPSRPWGPATRSSLRRSRRSSSPIPASPSWPRGRRDTRPGCRRSPCLSKARRRDCEE